MPASPSRARSSGSPGVTCGSPRSSTARSSSSGPTTGRLATPLFLCLIAIEASDVLFAVDSIPAIFGVTTDPFVVFTSNAFAILGLRSLYFLLADAAARFRYLPLGLAAVLLFIGAKLVLSPWLHLPALVSLAAVVGIVTVAVVASFFAERRQLAPGPGRIPPVFRDQ